jgi:hypothetical protein
MCFIVNQGCVAIYNLAYYEANKAKFVTANAGAVLTTIRESPTLPADVKDKAKNAAENVEMTAESRRPLPFDNMEPAGTGCCCVVQ